jgi:hypothetical protein
MAIWDYDVHYRATTAQYYAEIFDCETGHVYWCSVPMASEADCEQVALAHLRRLEE